MRRLCNCLSLLVALGLFACGKPAEPPQSTPEAATSATPPLQPPTNPAETAAPTATPEATITTAQPVAPTGAAPQAAGPAGTLNVFMYSEYIDPELLKQFKAQTNLEVNLSVYEATEEMMAKLQQAGGVKQYDVVVASDHAIRTLRALNLLQPLQNDLLPNKANIMPRFANPPYDPNNAYSVPYQWGTQGIIIDKQKVPKYEESWGLFFDADMQAGNFLLLDSMRDMLGAALKYQGHSMNSVNLEELKAAGELVQRAKSSPKALGFEGSAGGKNKVADGTVAYAIAYNGDAIRAVDEDQSGHLAFFVPREGTLIWVDAMVIPAEAPNAVGAHQFINFILDPQVGATLSNFNKYATPNNASLPLIKPEDRANIGIYPPEDQMAKMEMLQDVEAATAAYDQVWTSIKAK